eukprot:scaffold2939_cov406-Prasinococcus_capsulatus_cf.AAC.4
MSLSYNPLDCPHRGKSLKGTHSGKWPVRRGLLLSLRAAAKAVATLRKDPAITDSVQHELRGASLVSKDYRFPNGNGTTINVYRACPTSYGR